MRRLAVAAWVSALTWGACAQSSAPARTLLDSVQEHASAGTSAEPPSTPVPMLMRDHGVWTLMLHGNGFVSDIQQQAANQRGRDAIFSTNWIMPMAQRKLGPAGELTLRAMFSLEPATIGSRQYPELFQQGETAYGKPISDGQHPHDFFMEIAALYDLKLSPNTLLSIYAAPVGDPAIGPTAYPHRLSASEDPIAALGHHQEDSTHIAFNVLTGGLTFRWARLELSGFHGAEPDGSPLAHRTVTQWTCDRLRCNASHPFSQPRLERPVFHRAHRLTRSSVPRRRSTAANRKRNVSPHLQRASDAPEEHERQHE